MKKKIIYIAIVAFAILLFGTINVHAETDTFSELTMDIIIDDEGTATITETWDIAVYDGTELYKSYYYMETSEIQNLQVSDETGTQYEVLEEWDTNLSQEEKTNTCGINYVTDGYEICFGIGEYGEHTYTMTYEITNFVSEYEDDYQFSYFTLVPQSMEPAPESVKITIRAEEFEFTDDNVTASGSGFTGNTIIEDGAVVIETTSAMKSSQSVTIELEYDVDTFDTADIITSDDYSSYYYDTDAIETSQSKTTNTTQEEGTTSSWTSYIPYVLVVLIIIVVIVFIFVSRNKNKPEVI